MASREAFANIHARKVVGLVQQTIYDEVNGRRLRKERSMRHRIYRQIATGAEAPDARRGDVSCSGSIGAPSAFGGDDKIVRCLEELIDAHIDEPSQRIASRMVIRNERRICAARRPRGHLYRGNQLSIGIHRVESRKIARCVIRQPHDSVGHK